MDLRFKVDLRGYRKGMNDVLKRQLPYANALALTATAGHAGVAWQAEMAAKLDRPTPFTLGGVVVRAARKNNLVAEVMMRDVAATYLAPFVEGGPHALGNKKSILTPKRVPLNTYGNLAPNKLNALKAKPNVFVGEIKTRSGQMVNGVWQRKGGSKGKGKGRAKGPGSLKLLIRFTDPQPVTQRLDFKGRTERAIREHFNAEFDKAWAKAVATAR